MIYLRLKYIYAKTTVDTTYGTCTVQVQYNIRVIFTDWERS